MCWREVGRSGKNDYISRILYRLDGLTKHEVSMKKIIIIDGGPRRNMNTAGMLQALAEGARSAGKEVEVE